MVCARMTLFLLACCFGDLNQSFDIVHHTNRVHDNKAFNIQYMLVLCSSVMYSRYPKAMQMFIFTDTLNEGSGFRTNETKNCVI